jgi:hypothetical protein
LRDLRLSDAIVCAAGHWLNIADAYIAFVHSAAKQKNYLKLEMLF